MTQDAKPKMQDRYSPTPDAPTGLLSRGSPVRDAQPPTHGSFEPKIIAFLCNWCSYAGADLAGTSRMKYAPNIRIIKVPCTGRIDPLFILKAFEVGADGVLVSGCHPNDCHYRSGNFLARRRWMVFKDMLEFVGIEQGRIHFSWVSAAEGAKFVEVVNKVTNEVKKLGPFKKLEITHSL